MRPYERFRDKPLVLEGDSLHTVNVIKVRSAGDVGQWPLADIRKMSDEFPAIEVVNTVREGNLRAD